MSHANEKSSETTSTPEQSLSQSDADMARVMEDLIDVLIQRGVIQFTDLPAPAQAKLLNRRKTRSQIGQSLQLLPDNEPDDLI